LRLQTIDIDPVDVDADGISAAATFSGGGVQSFTLGGALTSGGTYTAGDGDAARQISVLSDADDTGRSVAVTGTDADGRAQTETIAPANAGTTESVKYWKTVTAATVDADTAGNLSIGTVDELVSPTIVLDRHSETAALCQINITGTIDITVQVTVSNPQVVASDQESIPWVSTQDAGLVAISADDLGSLDLGATACRLKVNTHSSGGEVQMYLSQPSN